VEETDHVVAGQETGGVAAAECGLVCYVRVAVGVICSSKSAATDTLVLKNGENARNVQIKRILPGLIEATPLRSKRRV